MQDEIKKATMKTKHFVKVQITFFFFNFKYKEDFLSITTKMYKLNVFFTFSIDNKNIKKLCNRLPVALNLK